MELQLQTEDGKRLTTVLADWMKKSQLIENELKRMLLMCSLSMKSEDKFITVLYGQKVLDESPCVLVQIKILLTFAKIWKTSDDLEFFYFFPQSQRFPSTLLRAQHAIEVSLKKSCTKELVVALERGGNPSLLTQMLSWSEKNSNEIVNIFFCYYFLTQCSFDLERPIHGHFMHTAL